MKSISKILTVALPCLVAGLFAAGQANAAVSYVYVTTSPVDVPGIANFNTHGSMMSGMSVTATFSTGFSETLGWAATGQDSGGVTGNGWSLGLTGDSYTNYWNFSFLQTTAPLTLTSLVLDGAPGFTVFDLYLDGDTGTTNSWAGRDFEFLLTYNVTATYSKPVGVAGAPPYESDPTADPPLPPHDLWQVLTVDFGNGISQDFKFRQDTDNDTRRIPEPGSLALLSAGLLGLGFTRRRKS